MLPRRLLAALLLALVAAPHLLHAQTPAPAGVSPSGDGERLLTRRDLAAAGIFTAATLALTIVDKDIHRAFQDPSVQNDRTISDAANVFNHFQETYLTVGGLAMYGIGRLTKSRSTADIGFHVAEAVFTASLASQVIRGPLGRARPTVNGGTDQYDFHFFKGFGEFEYRAFPSIHSASGFAAATVVSREVAERWPRQKWWVSPVAYTLAATPGLTRLYYGKHWASDIVFGGFLGVLAGQKVVSYNHRHPNNRVNRFFLGPADGAAPQERVLRIGVERKF